ncbi:pepsin/retropepsin-like aspartic protease family protein [Flavicella sediminum]|uniref:pepsin/retropepsin-like aspartic protease family protein n=1 Tax=Flavicella sediminum TaxID=2585141 RepID=UPI0014079B58|nr:aspartyl protease family protein [Flavicella sediminum]
MLHNRKKQSFKFKSINNLIIIPLKVNGVQGSYILDTGLSTNILFKAKTKIDSSYANLRKVTLNGFGNGPNMEAIVTVDNTFQLENLQATKQRMLLVLDEHVNLSAKMGMTIDGMIGYEFFKNFIVKINYRSKQITVYNPQYFKKKTRKSYHTFPLQFHKYKPYLKGKVLLANNKEIKTPVKLLIDTGGSDALWLFEDAAQNLIPTETHFKDFLGESISGSIFGNKCRIEEFQIGDFIFKQPIVSFLDKKSTELARRIKNRNGSVGGGLLRRFVVWFDYGNKEITLKKSRGFRDAFTYNMSGLDMNYSGDILIAETKISSFYVQDKEQKLKLTKDFKFSLKPSYIVGHVRENSPGALAGAQVGDLVLKVNRKASYKMSFDEINTLFYTKKNKWVRLLVARDGKEITLKFKLQNEL